MVYNILFLFFLRKTQKNNHFKHLKKKNKKEGKVFWEFEKWTFINVRFSFSQKNLGKKIKI
jgi:hypothetical protein